MKKFIRKLKNWFLTIVLTLGWVLDIGLGLLPMLTKELHLAPEVSVYFRIAMGIITAVTLKLQAPSKNPVKLQRMTNKAKAIQQKE